MTTYVIMAPGWREEIDVRGIPFLNRVAKEIAKDARGNILEASNVRTGDLYKSVHVVGKNIMIGTDHWEFIEFGTTRHIINPNRGRALYSAERHFGPARRVDHPGNRAYAPMRRAAYKRRTLRF